MFLKTYGQQGLDLLQKAFKLYVNGLIDTFLTITYEQKYKVESGTSLGSI